MRILPVDPCKARIRRSFCGRDRTYARPVEHGLGTERDHQPSADALARRPAIHRALPGDGRSLSLGQIGGRLGAPASGKPLAWYSSRPLESDLGPPKFHSADRPLWSSAKSKGASSLGAPYPCCSPEDVAMGTFDSTSFRSAEPCDLAIRPIVSSSDGPCTSSNPSRANMHD